MPAGSSYPEDVPELDDEPEPLPLLLEPEPELLDEGDAALSRAIAAGGRLLRQGTALLPGHQSPADPHLVLQAAKAA
jgi:hypothetical protein